jgi:hypothetical protein
MNPGNTETTCRPGVTLSVAAVRELASGALGSRSKGGTRVTSGGKVRLV